MSRDPIALGVVTASALSLIGIFSWELYSLYNQRQLDTQQYQVEFALNLKFINSPEFVNVHSDGCERISATHYCLNVTGHCQGQLANVTSLSERVWAHIREEANANYLKLLNVGNISIENIQSVFVDYFNSNLICNQSGFVKRLKQNTSFLVTAHWSSDDLWPEYCQLIGFEPDLPALLVTRLYHCDPVTVARGMTAAIPTIWKAVSLNSLGFLVSTGVWAGLAAERLVGRMQDLPTSFYLSSID